MYTIVTGFFNIQRDKWSHYSRSLEKYKDNFRRISTIPDPMIIFVEKELYDFVLECRQDKAEITTIHIITIQDLYYYPYYQQIETIMNSDDFKKDLKNPICPEICSPLYDVIMWSKIDLVARVVKNNPYQTSHFVWLDFGIHTHMFRDEMLLRPLFNKPIPNKLKFLCLSFPEPADLKISTYYKSNNVRLAGTSFSGDAHHMLLLETHVKTEVDRCLSQKVVDSDQAVFTQIYLQHPQLFDLHYGDWAQLLTNYYGLTENEGYVNQILHMCLDVTHNKSGVDAISQWLARSHSSSTITVEMMLSDQTLVTLAHSPLKCVVQNMMMIRNQHPMLRFSNCTEDVGPLLRPLGYSLNMNGYWIHPLSVNKISSIKITKIYLVCNWISSEGLCQLWEKMSQGNGIWNNLQIVSQSDGADYCVIINKSPSGHNFDPLKTIVFIMEPFTDKIKKEYWNDWYVSNGTAERGFLKFLDHTRYHNNCEWHLSLTYQELLSMKIKKDPSKDKVLSAIVSSKYQDIGHILRVDFLHYYESQLSSNEILDIYGAAENRFANYRGSLPSHQKEQGILPYKYSFNAENHVIKNYFTEKIIDCILGESLCFYWGCPNLEEYIDPRTFIRLDLDDKAGSLAIIREAITNNEWEKRIDIIRQMKQKILTQMQFFPRLEKILQEVQ